MKYVLCSLFLLLTACAELPPQRTDNACAIFQEKPDWQQQANKAAQRWGVSVPVLMAIMAQESSFVADAKPPRTWLLGFIPWTRPSSAYGYAQALDGTWAVYQNSAGEFFADAIDFIAWYNHTSHQQLGISLQDTKNLYLAYYQGLEGYTRKKHSPALQKTAAKVAKQAALFQNQLHYCQIN